MNLDAVHFWIAIQPTQEMERRSHIIDVLNQFV